MAFRRAFAAYLFAAGLASAVQADTVKVQAGDHDGFTRLVVSPGKVTGWSLGRTVDGYELRLTAPDAQFHVGRIFDRIQRQRIADIGPAERPGALGLTLGCDCHATAFAMSGGEIVIDIADGPPPKSSLFEQNFSAADQSLATPIEETAAVQPPTAPPADTYSPSSSATLSFRSTTDPVASLPRFWQSYGSAVPAPAPKAEISQIAQDSQLATADPAQNGPEPTMPVMSAADFAAPQSPLPLAIPDAETRATEEELLRQLSRAASQGLVVLPEPTPAVAADPVAAKPGSPGIVQADSKAHALSDSAKSDAAPAFFAETSLDRDTRDPTMSRHLTPVGTLCTPDRDLDLAKWGTDAPAAEQISEARAGLTGEFDRAEPEAVEKLVKLYLFLGMGHEAKQVLIAFPVRVPNAQLLADVGTLLDGGALSDTSALHGMRDCDTQVALWSFLGAPSGQDVKLVDPSVMVRAFSGLPAHLRHLLARQLANRMTEIGADDAARAIRNALARKVGAADRVVGMLDAERALDIGHLPSAAAKLDQLAVGNDQIAAQAVLLAVTARLKKGEAPPAKLVDAAAALAFEKQDSPDGAAYAQAALLGQAALGSFDEAVASYRRWRDAQPNSDRAAAAAALFEVVTDKADDARFLTDFFDGQDILAAVGPEAPVRLKVAARLADLGFGEEARQTLGAGMAQTDAGRLLSAKVALALYHPQEALANLQGLGGADADALRAAALAMAGDRWAAAPLFAALGNADAAASAAWSGGDFAAAATQSERLKKAADGLGLLATPAQSEAPGTTLSGSKTLLEQSAGVRQALDSLLGEPTPAPPSPPAAPKGG